MNSINSNRRSRLQAKKTFSIFNGIKLRTSRPSGICVQCVWKVLKLNFCSQHK